MLWSEEYLQVEPMHNNSAPCIFDLSRSIGYEDIQTENPLDTINNTAIQPVEKDSQKLMIKV